MESKLPKGWSFAGKGSVESKSFGKYTLTIDLAVLATGVPSHYFIWLQDNEGKEHKSKYVTIHDGIFDWDQAIEAAKEFTRDQLDDMHTKITQAMDMFEEVLGGDTE